MDKELRDKILGQTELPRRELVIPEWDCTVHVYALSGNERDELDTAFAVNKIGVRAKAAAMACRGADGDRLFTTAHMVALGKLSAAALDRIFTVVSELSGLQGGAVEAAKKNSEPEVSADSGTA